MNTTLCGSSFTHLNDIPVYPSRKRSYNRFPLTSVKSENVGEAQRFVSLLLNGTSALFRPLVPRIVEVEHMRHVKNHL